MHRDIAQWSHACHACQVNKVRHHQHSPILHIPISTEPFTNIHIDLVGPLPPCSGHTYLFTITGRFSRWLEAIPIKTSMADDCTNALMFHWVAWFGVPRQLTSDQGPQFPSFLWSSLVTTPGVELHHTSACHTQANRLVERFHRCLNASLQAHLNSPSWLRQLPWVLLALCSSISCNSQCSLADLIFKF